MRSANNTMFLTSDILMVYSTNTIRNITNNQLTIQASCSVIRDVFDSDLVVLTRVSIHPLFGPKKLIVCFFFAL